MDNRIKLIIGAVCGLLVLVGAAWLLTREKDSVEEGGPDTIVIDEDPLDVTHDFYTAWLDAALSTTSDPFTEGVIDSETLSSDVREHIRTASGNPDEMLDPVLCYEEIVPTTFRTKTIFVLDGEAQVLMLLRDGDPTPRQALVTLAVADAAWRITDITCKEGESGPEREFSFEKEGHLLKDAVPAPFNPEYWHIVFEENDLEGHVAPLFFDSASICVVGDGSESTCDPNMLTQAAAVRVQGEMSETGVTVKRLEVQ